MTGIILHQYASSTFSEKVRALLGFKQAAYRVVEIPVIMPRPFVMPLTGGYRKTPVLQIGADIFCDTALICRVIDQMYPDNSIYPENRAASDTAIANWIDTFLFRCAVAIAFQSGLDEGNSFFENDAEAAAFIADRADLAKGSDQLQIDLRIAESHFMTFLNDMDCQLGMTAFLGGETPTIADFSAFHLVWFLKGRQRLSAMFEPFTKVVNWFQIMSAFGHGDYLEIDGPSALAEARESEPDYFEETVFLEDIDAGAVVEVMPIDYGFHPVRGKLLAARFDEIVVSRNDSDLGTVFVHFPRIGFQVRRVS
jgi:glutathione S-transferase